ncbi:TIR protein [Nostoc sp. NIES-4103]|nr:TIR protein [Nostoc sp. NIES-4103]
MYFQKYLLARINTSLILALNDVDLVFEKPEIANDFCKMLRNWHDRARRDDRDSIVWKKLHLIIVHSTEVYASLDINSSPLANVGLVIELPEFTLDQVQRLLNLHGLNLATDEVSQIVDLLGGHPLLLRITCDYLRLSEITFQEFLEVAPTLEGPFRGHLLEYLKILENNPELNTAFRQAIAANQPVQLSPTIARTLQRLGLVKLEKNFAKPRCNLYRQFFRFYL